MKRASYLMIAATCILFLVSCSNDSKIVSNALTVGTWRVAHFSEDGNDQTQYFTGYIFTFNDNGTVTAGDGNNAVSGTWSTGEDDSQHKLYLNFDGGGVFDELNEDWHILEHNAGSITLEHISGGNGGTDNLRFEQI